MLLACTINAPINAPTRNIESSYARESQVTSSSMVLLIRHVFHPIHDLPVLFLLNCDVCHRRRRLSSMPVTFVRREPDDVTGMNFLDRPSVALRQSTAGRDDEGLTKWVRMPRRTCAGLERNTGNRNQRRIRRCYKWVNTHRPGEPLCWAFRRWLRSNSLDLHATLLRIRSVLPAAVQCA